MTAIPPPALDAAGEQEPPPQVKLTKSLLDTGTAAYDPSPTTPPDEVEKARVEFQDTIDR
jgi:hypothetical protein